MSPAGLQKKGIAALVLKYRILENLGEGIPKMDMDQAGWCGIADGIQALKVVRQRAMGYCVARLESRRGK